MALIARKTWSFFSFHEEAVMKLLTPVSFQLQFPIIFILWFLKHYHEYCIHIAKTSVVISGMVGDWKKHFSPELQGMVDQWIQKNLKDSDLSPVWCLGSAMSLQVEMKATSWELQFVPKSIVFCLSYRAPDISSVKL